MLIFHYDDQTNYISVYLTSACVKSHISLFQVLVLQDIDHCWSCYWSIFHPRLYFRQRLVCYFSPQSINCVLPL